MSGGPASKASSAAPRRSRYRLNHQPLPHFFVEEKLSSTKLVPGAKRLGTAEVSYQQKGGLERPLLVRSQEGVSGVGGWKEWARLLRVCVCGLPQAGSLWTLTQGPRRP